jgi:hypothetical protein
MASDPRKGALGNSRGALRLWPPWTFVIVLLPTVFLSWLFLRPFLAPSLNAQELRGKQIYFEGTGPAGGKIVAYVGADKVKLPGSAATCASCHGPDGRGRPEAGVIPSDITWSHLAKRYGHSHPMGRKHPAFTEATLKRSILNGNDPAGSQDEKNQILARAQAVLKRVQAGENFAKLAAAHSDDAGSKAKGGDLGYFSPGQMVPDFEDVAFYTNPGETSDIVETKYGYHIIRVEDHIDARERSFEEMKDVIREKLHKQLVMFKVEKLIRQATEEAGMQIYPDRMAEK